MFLVVIYDSKCLLMNDLSQPCYQFLYLLVLDFTVCRSFISLQGVKFHYMQRCPHLGISALLKVIFVLFMQAKTEAEVLLEKEGLSQDRVWVVHKRGFSLGTVVHDSPKKTVLSTHVSFFRVQVITHCNVIISVGGICGKQFTLQDTIMYYYVSILIIIIIESMSSFWEVILQQITEQLSRDGQ